MPPRDEEDAAARNPEFEADEGPDPRPGATPIEACRNLGALTGAELRAVGIASLADLRRAGWEEALARWAELFPARRNVNAARALAGALHDLDWRRLPPALVAAARRAARPR